MRHITTTGFLLLAFLLLSLTPSITARNSIPDKLDSQLTALDDPAYCIAGHRIGKLSLAVNNYATLGNGWVLGAATDCFTGEIVPSCDYPINSGLTYLFAGALWIGAVVGNDTLVSTGADGWSEGTEYRPDASPDGDMIYRSTRLGDPEARSEEDYIAVCYDTSEYLDPWSWTGLPHQPLNLEVVQKSYAWSYPHADDFVLFEFEITNIGSQTLDDTYIGFYIDGDVGHESNWERYYDDITGFMEYDDVAMPGGLCDYRDTVNMAWIADNNGDPIGGDFVNTSATGVTGLRLIRLPSDQTRVSYNWWLSNADPSKDFAPREHAGVGVWPEDFRDFGTGGLGTPEGDCNKYYVLRNREFDYDQIYTAVIPDDDPLWMYPDQGEADDFADGFDTRFLLSFGISDGLDPGETLPLAVAYVGGENFHVDPSNLDNLPYNPETYYDNLDFSNFASNARYAEWVYDNPGIDTDHDGDSGRTIDCGGEIVYIEGDGVPDYRAATAPRAPRIWAEWHVGMMETSLKIRWNGYFSETTPDVVSRILDFEGYNVYMSTDGTPGSYALVGAYDIDNYVKYTWDASAVPTADWRLCDEPFTLEELRCLYAASCEDESFFPFNYTSGSPYVDGDSMFYFEAVGSNYPHTFAKTYHDQPYPSNLDPALADPSELTDDGYFKYFEYGLSLYGITPDAGSCRYISVTAFDYGWPGSGALPLESDCEGEAVDVCMTGVYDDLKELPQTFALRQNHPNPFNPSTEIQFSLPRASHVNLEIFNVTGQRVTTLVNREMNTGHHSVTFDGSDIASGVYMYRLSAGNFVESKKMMLVK